MRTPFNIILAGFLLGLLPLAAQEQPGFGFLNIVNLIPGDIPADVTIGGKALMPDGLSPTSATGWFMVPPGEMDISVSLDQPEETQPRIRKANAPLPVAAGVSNLIVIFLQPEPPPEPGDPPAPPRIRMRSFPAFDGEGFALKFVSVCTELKRFQIGSNLLEAKPLDVLDIRNWAGGEFDIMHNGQAIGKVPASSEKGSFYLFVGIAADGGFFHVLTRSDTQTAPPWMKADKSENRQP